MYKPWKLFALVAGGALLLAACGPGADTVDPEITMTSPADGSSGAVGTPLTVAGEATDDTGVVRVEIYIDDELVQSTVTTDNAWSFDWHPTETGEFDIFARAVDAAANQADTDTVTVEVVAAGGTVAGTITRTAATGTGLTPSDAGSADVAPIAPGEVFITFARDLPQVRLGTSASLGEFTFESGGDFTFRGLEFEQLREYNLSPQSLGFYRIPGLDEAATHDLVADLRASGEVAEAFPNWILSQMATPDDPLYAMQEWQFEQLNLPAAWDTETGDTSRIPVAVLDSGRYDHDDLEWADVGANLVNWDPVTEQPDPDEGPIDNPYTVPGGSPHGTHVAGTIGALSDNGIGVAGVNWNVDIIPVKVLGQLGSGSLIGIIEGLWWAAGYVDDSYDGHVNPLPAQVANLSLGGNIAEPCPDAVNGIFQVLSEAFGMHAVVAAGNDSSPSDVYFPASCASVITVGATGLTGERAFYSNFGPFVDVLAPGGDSDYEHPLDDTLPAGVLSTTVSFTEFPTITPTYGFNQGTSMASPHVAGVVALMLAREPGLGLEEIRSRLHNASHPLTEAECNVPHVGATGINMCGAGLLDAEAALLATTVTTPTAVAYAIPYDGADAPDIGYGNLSSLEGLALHKVDATSLSDGDFGFDFGILPAGSYLVVGLELRDADTSVSHIDRIGTVEVEVLEGGSEDLTVVVEPIYLTLR